MAAAAAGALALLASEDAHAWTATDNFYEAKDNKEPGITVTNRWAEYDALTWNCITLANDAASVDLKPPGFALDFYDRTPIAGAWINSNGMVALDVSTTSTAGAFGTSAPNHWIGPAWKNLDPSAGGTICHRTSTDPDRIFAVRFKDVPTSGGGCCVTGLVLLYENLDILEIHYSATASGGAQGMEGSGTINVQRINYGTVARTDHAVHLRPKQDASRPYYDEMFPEAVADPTFVIDYEVSDSIVVPSACPATGDKGLLCNDVQLGSVPISGAVLVTGPASGDLTLDSGGGFTFTAPTVQPCGPSGESQDYTFVYRADDPWPNDNRAVGLAKDKATVTVRVENCNRAPLALDHEVEVAEGESPFELAVLVGSSDEDGDTVTLAHVGDPVSPSKGTVEILDQGTPDPADDTVLYSLLDGNVNDATAPVGADTFSYTLEDGQGGATTKTVTVSITPVNDAPRFTKSGDVALTEVAADTPFATTLALSSVAPGPAAATDEAGQALAFDVACKANCAGRIANVVVERVPGPTSGSEASLSFTQLAYANTASGAIVLCVSLSDDGGTDGGGQDTYPPAAQAPCGVGEGLPVEVSISAVNDPPTFTAPDPVTMQEGATASVLIEDVDEGGGADEEAQTLLVQALSDDTSILPHPGVTFNEAAGSASLSIQPVADAFTPSGDPVTVTVRVTDSAGKVSESTFTVTILGVNDEPAFTFGAPAAEQPDWPDLRVKNDEGPTDFPAFLVGIDEGGGLWEDSQDLEWTVTVPAAQHALFDSLPEITDWSEGDATATLSLDPKLDAIGTATVTLRLTDSGPGGPDDAPLGGHDRIKERTILVRVQSPFAQAANLVYPDAGAANPGACQSGPGAVEDTSFGVAGAAGLSCAVALAEDFTGTIVYEAVDLPANGDLTLSAGDGSWSYVPDPDFQGTDSFTYLVSDAADPEIVSNEATVTIQVAARNDPPTYTVADPLVDQVGAGPLREDMGALLFPGFATGIGPGGGSDEASQALTFHTVSLTRLAGAFDLPGAFAQAPAISATGTLSFRAAPEANGVFEYCFDLTDSGQPAGGGHFNRAPTTCATLTIAAVDDVPAFTAPTALTVGEDAGAQAFAGFASGISPGVGALDEAAQALAWQLETVESPLCTIDPMLQEPVALSPTGTLTFRPAANACGTITVHIRLAQSDEVHPDVADANAEPLGIHDSRTDVRTLTLTVSSINDAPVAQDDAFGPADGLVEDGSGILLLILANDHAGTGDPEQALSLKPPGAGTVPDVAAPLHGALDLMDCPSGPYTCVRYTPAADYNGPDTFRYVVYDHAGAPSGRATVTLQVANTPDLPVVLADRYMGRPDRTLAVPDGLGVLANDFEPDGALVTAVLASGPLHGTLELGPDGGFQYTPERGFSGTDSFTYRAVEVEGESEAATVTLDIRLNSPPVAAFVVQAPAQAALPVLFSDKSTDDVGIVSWDWSFGDGGRSGQPSPTHAFGRPGVYSIVLTVMDEDGALDTHRASYQTPGYGEERDETQLDLPVADAGPDQQVPAGALVRLAGSGPAGAAYAWVQVQGTPVALDAAAAQPTFTAPAVAAGATEALAFELRVTVGGRTSVADPVAVAVAGPAPPPMVLDLGADRTVAPGERIEVRAALANAPGDVSFAWSFPGLSGHPSGATLMAFAPALPGAFTIQAAATSLGQTVMDEVVVRVTGGDGIVASRARSVDGAVAFEAAQGLEVLEWDFGDGTRSSEASPQHHYAQSGTYDVVLRVATPEGDEHTFTEEVAVTVRPAAQAPSSAGGVPWAWIGGGAALLLIGGAALVALGRRGA